MLATFMAASVWGAGRPNIVIIMSDDSGYTDLGCYGSEIDTPNLDQLAAKGLRLGNFYTNGRCSPTRASLLSGLDCAKVGFGGGVVGDWVREMPYPAHRARMPYDIPLLPELMKAAGYRTLMSGKWHMGGSTMKFHKSQQKQWKHYHQGWELTEEEMEQDFLGLPLQRGFDEYFGLYGAQDSLFFVPGQYHPMMEGNEPAKLKYDREYTMHCFSKRKDLNYNVNHGKTGKAFYATDGVTDRAIEMIRDAAGQEQPFMLYVAYRAPHKPLQAPDGLVRKYLEKYEDLDAIGTDRVAGLKKEKLYPEAAEYRKAWIPPAREEMRLQLAIHSAMIEKIDENVGRLVDTLDASGELDNTLVLYFSDNGAAAHLQGIMNAPYHGVKALMWEGGTKTHFIASWPGKIKPGTISHEQAWVGDILPTCLELAGADYPDTFRGKKTEALAGRSMLPILQGTSRDPAEALFFNDKGQQAIIFQGRWKLLIEPGWYLQTRDKPGIAYELYDLETDPAETRNLANEKPEMVQNLSKKCEAWIKECGIVDYAKLIELRPNDPY
ncbi:Arylsulfatase [Pontiella desulfatans]|uniref:Arylsulfatase n=2 Tax=Pontiella desulfatans TaxID=2750659 RepID=A0A6C2TYU8_PONDE|nr:sulfatase S1_4 [Kiritimatiellales bacterium]VGO12775.1 Arylsulfatase [Pontiella desulfatans]